MAMLVSVVVDWEKGATAASAGGVESAQSYHYQAVLVDAVPGERVTVGTVYWDVDLTLGEEVFYGLAGGDEKFFFFLCGFTGPFKC